MPDSYQIYLEPQEEPIILSEMQDHLRLTCDVTGTLDDDAYIQLLIKAARTYCENYTNRAFITQTWKQSPNDFGSKITLHKNRVESITSVKYYDVDGNQQTYSDAYQLDNESDVAVIYPPIDGVFPSIQAGKINPIEILYVCGYGASDTIPEDIKHAIKWTVSHFYENREAVNVGMNIALQVRMPEGVKTLLNPYKLSYVG